MSDAAEVVVRLLEADLVAIQIRVTDACRRLEEFRDLQERERLVREQPSLIEEGAA